MKVEIENCSYCPLRAYIREQGASLDICVHEDRNGYNYIIKDKYQLPTWCPLKEDDVIITLKENK